MDARNFLYSMPVALACMGLREDGQPAFPAIELREILAVATELHRNSGWESPPDVLRLAAIGGVQVLELPGEVASAFACDQVWVSVALDSTDRMLLTAHGLAGALLLRRALDPRGAWVLAAEILVPSWAAPEDFTDDHGVPGWLVELRWGEPRSQAGRQRSPASRVRCRR